jgi:hypothetical protein
VAFDSGSTTTFLLRSVARAAYVTERDLKEEVIAGICGQQGSIILGRCQIVLRSLINPHIQVLLRNVCTIPMIAVPTATSAIQLDPKDEEEIVLTHPLGESTDIHLLLGADQMPRLLQSIVQGRRPHYTIWYSILGQAVSGSLSNKEHRLESYVAANFPSLSPQETANEQIIEISEGAFIQQLNLPDNLLSERLQQFWDSEVLALKEQNALLSPSELKCDEYFNKTTTYDEKGEFYTVRLPFKHATIRPLNNYKRVKGMFLSMEANLLKNTVKTEVYKKTFNEFIDLGFIEPVKDPTPESTESYLFSHHLVYSAVESHRTRTVFNASLPSSNTLSLNQTLMPGRNLLPDLALLLTRMRAGKFVSVSDISKMFLRVRLNTEDRRWVRLVWRDPGSRSPVQLYEFKVCPFGLVSAPYLCQNVVKIHIEKFRETHPQVVAQISTNLYMDDLILVENQEDQLVKSQTEAKEILSKAGLKLQKFVSNSKKALAAVPAEERSTKALLLHQPETYSGEEATLTKTLGISWDQSKDILTYRAFAQLAEQDWKPTLRSLASFVSSLFDPLGHIAPFSTLAKRVLKESWMICLDITKSTQPSWDLELPQPVATNFQALLDQLQYLKDFEVPRPFSEFVARYRWLFGFSDASLIAKAAVVYIVSEAENGTRICRLVAAKNHLASVKQASVAKLELDALRILASLIKNLSATLNVPIHTCFTDSSCTFMWTQRCSSSWPTYTANRVSYIHSVLKPQQVRWLPGEFNSASDMVSRGGTVQELIAFPEWITGPPFLSLPESQWPKHEEIPRDPEVDLERKKPKYLALTVTIKPVLTINFPLFKKLFNHFNFFTGIRILTYLYKFIHRCRNKFLIKSGRKNQMITVNPDYVPEDSAKNAWRLFLEHVQEDSFANWQYDIAKKRGAVPWPKKLDELFPFVDKDGLLRVGGRLQYAPISVEQKHPYILDGHHVLVQKMINSMHKQLNHASPSMVLSTLQQRFWIIGGRSVITKALNKCIRCKRLRAKPTFQKMAPATLNRVTPGAFRHIAIDFMGPALCLEVLPHLAIKGKYTKMTPQQRAIRAAERKLELDRKGIAHCAGCSICEFYHKGDDKSADTMKVKVYTLIITCLSSRAVAFEECYDMQTHTVLQALTRVFAIYGQPESIQSDNQRSFEKANADFAKLYSKVNWEQVQAELSNRIAPPTWYFVPVYSPHWNAAAERCVGMCKRALRRILGSFKPNLQDYKTALRATAALLNDRPLCRVDTTSPEDNETLTPSMLVFGRRIHAIPALFTPLEDSLKQRLPEIYRKQGKFVQSAWYRWRSEYLCTLQRAEKWLAEGHQLRPGDIVMFNDGSNKRMTWPLGVIIKAIPSKDRRIRVVRLRTAAGEIERSVTQVYLLEAHEDGDPPPSLGDQQEFIPPNP